MKKNILFMIILSILLINACTQNNNDIAPPKPNMKLKPLAAVGEIKASYEEYDKLPESFIKNMKDFSAELGREYLSSVNGKNGLISPISIRYAFSTLAEGSDTHTKDLLSKFVHEKIGTEYSENNRMHKAYLNDIISRRSDERAKLVIKDSVWIDDDLKDVKEDFVKNAAKYHYAEIYNADLGDQEVADAMNEWVKKATNNLIDPKRQANSELRLTILNTVYFKDGWAKKFTESKNTKDKFTITDKKTVEVEFMHGYHKDSEVYEHKDFVVAKMPFQNGAVFKVLLPNEGVALKQLLEKGNLNSTIDSLLNAELKVPVSIHWHVPKFQFKSEIDLKDVMSSIGYGEIFSKNADFSRLADTELYVSDSRQLTNFILNNEGVEAAAYTEINMKSNSLPLDEKLREIDINLNSPFLYSIELIDGTPIFMGIMNDPSSSSSK